MHSDDCCMVDWEANEDGEREAPMMDNPAYKGDQIGFRENALCTVMLVAWLIGKQKKTGSGRHA